MGAKAQVDPLAIIDMVQKGMTTVQIAEALNVSRPTLARKIEELRAEQSVLLDYRNVRHLNLTRLQADILDAITPDKIAAAPLKDLCAAYKILADKEGDLTGEGEGKMKGLLSYLLRLEEQDLSSLTEGADEAEVIELFALPSCEGDSDAADDSTGDDEPLPKLS